MIMKNLDYHFQNAFTESKHHKNTPQFFQIEQSF